MIEIDLISMIVGGAAGISAMTFWNWFYKRRYKLRITAQELKEAHYNLKKADDVIRKLHNIIKNA